MTRSKKASRNIIVALVLMLTLICTSTETFAASYNSYGAGRWYLGHFTFTNYNRGKVMQINGSKMRVCVAFKKADSQPTNIDLKVNIDRYSVENGVGYYFNRQSNYFYNRNDAPDSDGYYYFVGDWLELGSESGKLFSLYYDAVTELGQAGTGGYRSADVHVWIDIE